MLPSWACSMREMDIETHLEVVNVKGSNVFAFVDAHVT